MSTLPVSCCLGFNSSQQQCQGSQTCGFDSNGNPTQDMLYAVSYCTGVIDSQYQKDAFQSSFYAPGEGYLQDPRNWSTIPNFMNVAPRMAAGPCYGWGTSLSLVEDPTFQTLLYYQVKTPFCASNPTNPWCACLLPQSSIYANIYEIVVGAANDGNINFVGGNVEGFGAVDAPMCWWFPCKNTDLTEIFQAYFPTLNCPNEIICIDSGNTVNITGSSNDTINFVNNCSNDSNNNDSTGLTWKQIAIYTAVTVGVALLLGLFIWSLTLLNKKKVQRVEGRPRS